MIDPQALFDGDLEFAEQRIMATGQLVPMFSVHFITEDGGQGVAAVVGDFTDDQSKMQSVKLVRMIGVAMDAYAISLMTEAWVAHVDPGMDEAVKNLAPSERMDRKEIVMVTMSVRDKPTLFCARDILRDADGKVTGLAPDVTDQHTGFEGRMANLLAPRRPTERERRTAAAVIDLMGIKMEKLSRH